MTLDTRVRWHAWHDGVAHAVRGRGRRVLRTECGVRVLEERHDRPETSRCPACLVLVPPEVKPTRHR